MRHGLARVWARLVVTLSVCVLLAGLVGGGAALFFDWRWAGLSEPTQDARLLAAALLVLGGILVATPGIIIGELVLILLAQRRLLARIDRHLRWVLEPRDEEHEPPAARRLMGRPRRRE